MGLGMIRDAFLKGFRLTSKEWKGIFREFLAVNAFALLIVLFSVIVGGAMIYFGMSGGAEIASVSGAILIIVLFLLVSSAASSISYNIIEEKISGMKHDIWGDFVKNLLPVSAYTIILWLAIGIFAFIPTFVLSLLGSGGFVSEIALGLASQAYYYLALFLIGFVLQFSLFELVIAKAAVLQSMGRSVSIVRRTGMETMLFYIIGGIFSTIVQILLSIPALVLIFLPLWVLMNAEAQFSNPNLIFPLIIFGGLYVFAILVVFMAAKLTITLPINYYYWRMARKA